MSFFIHKSRGHTPSYIAIYSGYIILIVNRTIDVFFIKEYTIWRISPKLFLILQKKQSGANHLEQNPFALHIRVTYFLASFDINTLLVYSKITRIICFLRYIHTITDEVSFLNLQKSSVRDWMCVLENTNCYCIRTVIILQSVSENLAIGFREHS